MRSTGLVAIAVVNLACASGGDARETPRMPEGPVALRYRTLDGEWRTLGGLRGRVVVVHVFTTWSDPSLVEVPRLAALARRYPERVEVVGLSVDVEPEATRVFAETFDVPYDVGRVPDLASFMGPSGPFGPIGIIPTSVVLDPAGRIAARVDGMWGEGVLEAVVERVLRL
jgi:thiol-disulfide isomerase/thioredoxin